MESDMTQRSVPVLAEALSDKDALIPSQHKSAYARAEKEWGDIATTNQGKLAVIEAAKAGEELAVLYLLKVMLDDGRIQKMLWEFLGPNPAFQQKRIAAGDTAIYRSIVLEALQNVLTGRGADEAGEEKDVWKWEADKATQGGDYINSLKWHVIRNIKTKITRYGTEQNRGGMGGRILKSRGEEKPQIGSYEAYTDEHDIEAEHDQFRGAEDLDAWGTFVDDEALDAGREPTTRAILKFFLSRGDFDVTAAADNFGKTNMTIRTKLASMKDILERHGVTQDVLMNLLKDVGPKELARTL